MHVHLRLKIAPFLAWSCVQVGVAVEGATHAATAAASLILTQPGLSSLVPAVLSARRICRRLVVYLTYRFRVAFHLVAFLALMTPCAGRATLEWLLSGRVTTGERTWKASASPERDSLCILGRFGARLLGQLAILRG